MALGVNPDAWQELLNQVLAVAREPDTDDLERGEEVGRVHNCACRLLLRTHREVYNHPMRYLICG